MAYATLTEIKADRNITGVTEDVILQDKLDAATARIDEYTNREFAVSANSDRYFDSCSDVDGLTLFLDKDIHTITSITNGDGTAVASTDYVTQPRNATPYYAIKLKSSKSLWWEDDTNGDSEDAITVNGKWGYSEAANALVKSVCLELAGYYYVRRQSQEYDITATPELGQMTAPGTGERSILARLFNLVRT